VSAEVGEPAAFVLGLTSMDRIAGLLEQSDALRIRPAETYLAVPPERIMRVYPMSNTAIWIDDANHALFSQLRLDDLELLDFENLDNRQVVADHASLPSWDAELIVEIDQDRAFAELNGWTAFFLISIAVLSVLLVSVMTVTTQQSLRPLAELAQFSERISEGDWKYRVSADRDDEIGRLGSSLNMMAEELEGFYRSLEDRVEARTRQIRTASEIARDAALVRDVDRLLDETVTLISSRFNFYHAGVFLIDDTGEFADLRAASSAGGKRMLGRGHKLAVGKVGIVGYVTGTGRPRIALDVGADAVHFANPDLPDTRSEMALPLRLGDRVIGALDVQSVDPNAFEEEDILTLQTMADQLAVAIENANLLEEHTKLSGQRRQVIDIFNQLTRFLAYDELVASSTRIIRESLDFNRVLLGLVEGQEIRIVSGSSHDPNKRIVLGDSAPIGRGYLGKSVSLKAPVVSLPTDSDEGFSQELIEAEKNLSLCVPLISRGVAIGTLAVELQHRGVPGEQEIEIVELLANQVAASLENARLFEETQSSLQQLDALYRQQTEQAWDQTMQALAGQRSSIAAEYTSGGFSGRSSISGDSIETPISLRGEIIGALNITSKSPDEWEDDDRVIIQAVADEVAGTLEQLRLVEELGRRAQQLQLAAEVARDATGLLDVSTLLNRAVTLIKDRFDFYHVSVFLLDESGEQALIEEATGEAGRRMKESQHHLKVGSQSVIGYVTEVGEAYVAHDVGSDPLHKYNPLLPETQSELGLPLRLGDRVIGAIDVQSTQAGSFSEDDITVLEILSDQLAVAVHNARLFEQTLERAKREETVTSITSKIRTADDLDKMLQTAVQEMRTALGATRARIQLTDPYEETLEQKGTRDFPDSPQLKDGEQSREGDEA
jgi:GAF domain-containing protein/HAMP domain-containing protein